MSSKIKIGLIGCGRAAELIYAPVLSKFSEVELIGVVDPIKERGEQISNKFQYCSSYSFVETKFIDQIDAAIISTPPDSHVELASLLLKNNKHVLVEKPLSLSMDGIKELSEIEMHSNASLMMGFNHRYWQPITDLKNNQLTDSKIKSAEIIFTSDNSKWNPISFTSDPLDDLGPHVFDLIRFIFNKGIISIAAKEKIKNDYQLSVCVDGNICVNVRIAFLQQTLKSISVVTNHKKYLLTIGSERIAEPLLMKRSIVDFYDRVKRKFLGQSSPLKKSYELQVKNFFETLLNRSEPSPGITDGIAAILAGIAARKSLNENGKEIYLNEK